MTIGQNMAMSVRKHDEIRRREADILAGARELFDRIDWPSVTMDEIADKAGVSKGTLYNHFASKDDVYARLLVEFSEQLLGRLGEIDRDKPADERVRAMLAVFWESYRQAPQFRRIASYCDRDNFRSCLSAPLRDALEALDRRFLALAAAVLKQGSAEGRFHAPTEAGVLALQLMVAGMSRFLWASKVGPAAKDRQFMAICDFTLAGLRGVAG
jgi:AcrR family transcriptional regulator